MNLIEKISSLSPPSLTVIASRPAMGKTTIALNIALYKALHEQAPIVFFSLELSKKQLVEKMNIPQSKLLIDDTADITVSQIHQKCREEKDAHGLGLIVIDYFQLLRGGKADEKAAGLKDMSLDLGVPIIVTSQLIRSSEDRQENCPSISTDFGESGVLANFADNVIFLYREEHTDTEKPGECEFIIAKGKI